MGKDWRPELVRLVEIKQAASEVDLHGVWEYHLPKVAATEDQLAAVEAHLGFVLDPGYREFLTYANGWPSFCWSVDLFGTDDLMGGPRLAVANQMLDAIEPAVFEQAELERSGVVPVAATTVDLDLFVMPVRDGSQGSSVVWLAGYEVDRFESFADYVLAMVEYNARELGKLNGA